MLTLIILFLIAGLFFRFVGRLGFGLLALLAIIFVALLLLKVFILALPIVLIIGAVVWIARRLRRETSYL